MTKDLSFRGRNPKNLIQASKSLRKIYDFEAIQYTKSSFRISCKPEQSFRAVGEESHTTLKVIQSRYLLRLALNGYTQIQIEKILFPIMNFRFSPSARLVEESHVRLVRDISLSLNMTEDFSHSILDTESVSLIF